MTDAQSTNNLVTNAWNWDLIEFTERIGGDSRDEHVRQQFLAFQEAARALGNLSPEVLAAVCAPADDAEQSAPMAGQRAQNTVQ